jgi:hypothetical protein
MDSPSRPYVEQFPIGSRVQVADRAQLERFQAEWHYHHPLAAEQLAYAGHDAVVREVAFYHGGDVLYVLDGIPGIWRDGCLARAS